MLLGLAFLLGTAQAATSFSCATKFWPKLKPGENFTVNAQCQFYPGYPRTVGTTTVSVAYTEKWGAAARTNNFFDTVAPVLDDSFTKSLQYYGTLAKGPPEIVVIFTLRDQDPYSLDTWFPASKAPRCQVRIFRKFTTIITTNDAYAKQALAHELYHCVQQYKLGSYASEVVPSSLWVMEGSAQYFSNVVYPEANNEWLSAPQYDPTLPIYAQPGQQVYGTSLFFQSLEKARGAAYINKWVLSTKENNDAKVERRRLSALSGFTDDFYVFAQQFSLKSIIDTSGDAIPGLATVTPLPVSISGDAVVLQTTPFTPGVFQISPPSGYSVELSAAANSDQRVAYRFPRDTAWTNLPATVDLSCSETPTILLLSISTKDATSDSVKVSVKKTKKSCGGTGFVLYPLQDPDTLSAYCPPGTHVSTLAAWCCPDGSNLDEAHASEASVCCPGTTDCYSQVVPNNFRCADPNWVLWTKEYRQIGCCQKGYVPTSTRYCVKDSSKLGSGFSSISQAAAPTPSP